MPAPCIAGVRLHSDREMIQSFCHTVPARRLIYDLDTHCAAYVFLFLINTSPLYTRDTQHKNTHGLTKPLYRKNIFVFMAVRKSGKGGVRVMNFCRPSFPIQDFHSHITRRPPPFGRRVESCRCASARCPLSTRVLAWGSAKSLEASFQNL